MTEFLLSSTSSFPQALSSEIVSADVLQIFLYAIMAGVILGIFIGLLKRVTWWIW